MRQTLSQEEQFAYRAKYSAHMCCLFCSYLVVKKLGNRKVVYIIKKLIITPNDTNTYINNNNNNHNNNKIIICFE